MHVCFFQCGSLPTDRKFGDDIFCGGLLTRCLLLFLSGTRGCVAGTCEWKRSGWCSWGSAWRGCAWYRCQISWWVNSIF